MLWTIRGTDPVTEQDTFIVIEADTAAEAEYFARRRGFPVVVLEQATSGDIKAAGASGRLLRYSGSSPHEVLGRRVSAAQLAYLMASGLTTIFLLLRAQAIPLHW